MFTESDCVPSIEMKHGAPRACCPPLPRTGKTSYFLSANGTTCRQLLIEVVRRRVVAVITELIRLLRNALNQCMLTRSRVGALLLWMGPEDSE